jgi:hypothetical protein
MFACLCRDLIELAFQWAPTMQRKTQERDQDELERFWRRERGVVSQVLRFEMWT